MCVGAADCSGNDDDHLGHAISRGGVDPDPDATFDDDATGWLGAQCQALAREGGCVVRGKIKSFYQTDSHLPSYIRGINEPCSSSYPPC